MCEVSGLFVNPVRDDGYADPDDADDGFSSPESLKDLPDFRPIGLIFPDDQDAYIRAIAQTTMAKMMASVKPDPWETANRTDELGPVKHRSSPSLFRLEHFIRSSRERPKARHFSGTSWGPLWIPREFRPGSCLRGTCWKERLCFASADQVSFRRCERQ